MRTKTVIAMVVFGVLVSNTARADNVCEILARNLRQDVLKQGTLSDKFFQFQKLVADKQYKNWQNAKSSSQSYNGRFTIPNIVDLAIGDGKKSNQNNWHNRRKQFLSMTFQQTSLRYRSSAQISLTSVAALQAISNCAIRLADRYGVFSQLVSVSPQRDAFVLKLWRRTGGTPGWELENFSLRPKKDSNVKCDDDWQNASFHKKIPIPQQSVFISCQKNPNKHLTLTVQTTAGPAATFQLDSIHEEIRKFREDTEAQIATLQSRIDRLSSRINTVSQGLNKEITERGSAIAALSTSLTGVVAFEHENAPCPSGYRDLGTALLPRYHTVFDQYGFITPKYKPTSGVFQGNNDWRIDHIRLCIRE